MVSRPKGDRNGSSSWNDHKRRFNPRHVRRVRNGNSFGKLSGRICWRHALLRAGFDQIKSSSPPIWVDLVEQPATVSATAPSGLLWQFAPGTTQANGKLIAFAPGGGTPAGTISAPTITTVTNASPVALGTNGGALTQVAGASGITGVQAPTFTGTPGAAGAGQLGNVTYASVNAANLKFRAIFSKFI